MLAVNPIVSYIKMKINLFKIGKSQMIKQVPGHHPFTGTILELFGDCFINLGHILWSSKLLSRTLTIPLICSANEWTGFYMKGTSVMNELNRAVGELANVFPSV